MIGSIAGDIIGSVYEWDNIKTKEFPLFTERCFFPDDIQAAVYRILDRRLGDITRRFMRRYCGSCAG